MGVRLFVLGIVYEHDTHGYEIKAAARLWGVEKWAKIGFGSLYHALGSLEREGLIREIGVEQEGNRPPRTVYRVTDEGRTAFLTMLRKALVSVERVDADLALAFVPNLPPAERKSLLAERLVRLRSEADAASRFLLRARTELDAIPWVAASVQHGGALIDVEIAWTSGLLEHVVTFPARDWAQLSLV